MEDLNLNTIDQIVSFDDIFHRAAAYPYQSRIAGTGSKSFGNFVRSNNLGRADVVDGGGDTSHDMAVFCSADYLGLAHDDDMCAVASAAIQTYGLSVTSVPVIGGATDRHAALELRLAEVFGYESAILYQTGHAANTSAIAALCGRHDVVLVDSDVHPSLREGPRLASARIMSFQHNDADDLGEKLARLRAQGHQHGILVIAEGVYGLDGETSDVAELSRQARRHGARLYIDDCQGIGVVGHGRGVVALCGDDRPDLLMGAFSKALGSIGGFIAGPRMVIDYLRHHSTAAVFSIGSAPAFVVAAAAGLERAINDLSLRQSLETNIAHARARFSGLGSSNVLRSRSAILSVMVPGDKMLSVADHLFRAGVWAEALLPPATALGEERIRFRIRANHSLADIDRAADALAAAVSAEGACIA